MQTVNEARGTNALSSIAQLFGVLLHFVIAALDLFSRVKSRRVKSRGPCKRRDPSSHVTTSFPSRLGSLLSSGGGSMPSSRRSPSRFLSSSEIDTLLHLSETRMSVVKAKNKRSQGLLTLKLSNKMSRFSPSWDVNTPVCPDLNSESLASRTL
jgi:hypothetical protein